MAGRETSSAAFGFGLWTCLALSALATGSAPLSSQSPYTQNTLQLDANTTPPKASIETLDWLAGHWLGASSLGSVEEVWTAPSHGTMVGAFKVVKKDEAGPYFYEFEEIAEHEGSLILKVKHFNPDLLGWEEKDSYVAFPLVRMGDREAFFSGLTYRRVGDELRAWVAVDQGSGKTEEIEFVFALRGR